MPETGWTIVGPDRRLEFAAAVRGFLERDPVGNTVLLGNVVRLPVAVREPEADDCYGWWLDSTGAVGAAFLAAAGHAVTLSASVPARAAGELAAAWRAAGRARPAGVFGKVADAEGIAASWSALTGGSYRARAQHSMRLFSFEQPTPPDPEPRGRGRLATADDVQIATTWELGFLTECGIPHDGVREPFVRARIEEGRQMMWEVDGVPVAQAMHTPLAAGMVRIQAVYTPPEHRRNGYAAGLTWALSQHALANGAERVLLHTDLANPTSNGVYQRIGYRPVHDVTEFEFVE
jgi:GNAT superfamily N-acetyltransferase